MESSRTIKSFQSAIVKIAEGKLGRPLTEKEQQFISARQGFIALEAIHDAISAYPYADVERYLNSE